MLIDPQSLIHVRDHLITGFKKAQPSDSRGMQCNSTNLSFCYFELTFLIHGSRCDLSDTPVVSQDNTVSRSEVAVDSSGEPASNQAVRILTLVGETASTVTVEDTIDV
jgi:hypothetical protein